jgi:hypothetical protein
VLQWATRGNLVNKKREEDPASEGTTTGESERNMCFFLLKYWIG